MGNQGGENKNRNKLDFNEFFHFIADLIDLVFHRHIFMLYTLYNISYMYIYIYIYIYIHIKIYNIF